jgi:hypothetical protein
LNVLDVRFNARDALALLHRLHIFLTATARREVSAHR